MVSLKRGSTVYANLPPLSLSVSALSSHIPLPTLTKNRVSKKPKSRRPTRRTAATSNDSPVEVPSS